MKVFRGILTFCLILIIIGGSTFLIYQLANKSPNMVGMNMKSMEIKTNGDSNSMGMPMNKNSNDTTASYNSTKNPMNTRINIDYTTTLIDEKNKLNDVITTLKEALNNITNDPYSKVTVKSNYGVMNSPPSANTTVNIYPNSVEKNNSTSMTDGFMVYNQEKLQQMHNGIFKISQGMWLLGVLYDNMNSQLAIADKSLDSEFYNLQLQNKITLSNALKLISDGSNFINVNPYDSGKGYEYNAVAMEQLHSGIYKLAQGLMLGNSLNNDFTKNTQNINLAYNRYSKSMDATNSMNPMPMNSNFNISTIFSIVMFVFIILLFISLVAIIRGIFRTKPKTIR